MKRLTWLLLILVISACAPAQAPEEPAVSVSNEAILVPESLGPEWIHTSAGNTDMYAKEEGIYDEETGWVTFNYKDHKILAILTTTPNPSNEGQPYSLKFDVQWVEGDLVLDHAVCFDVEQYNVNLDYDTDTKYYSTNLPIVDHLSTANEVETETYGCGFGEYPTDVVYLVHKQLVKSSALQELNQP